MTVVTNAISFSGRPEKVRLGLCEIDWTYIGAKLAQESNHEQRAFFQGFCKELGSFDTRYQSETQLSNVAIDLTDEEKELLSILSYKE